MMSAPSFSSFPPAFTSFPDIQAEASEKDSGEEPKEEKSHISRPKKVRDYGDRKDKDKKRKNRDGERRRDSERQRDTKRKHSTFRPLDDERAKAEEDRHARVGKSHYADGAPGLFTVDKTGDPMNIVYGGLHSGDIPRYRRAGYGNVLGLPQSFKIITRGTGGKSLEIGLYGRRPPARYTDSRSFALLTTTRTRRLIPQSDAFNDVDGGDLEFIRLSRRRHFSDDPLTTYRSILPTRDSDAESSPEASSRDSGGDESSSESDAGITVPRTAHQHALAALESELQKDPTSLPTWIALLEETLTTTPPSNRSSLARARAEIKLAVLDRAMKMHVRNKSSVELRLRWLNAGAEVWDTHKLENEWDSAMMELGVKKSGRNEDSKARNWMWEEWLRWRCSSAGKGSRKGSGVEGMVEDAVRVLQNVDGELPKIKVIWWLSLTLKRAGFSERAMAIFQAQVELSHNCPPSLLSAPLDTRLNVLEEFWETDLPRVGEVGSLGWDSWDGQERAKSPVTGVSSTLPNPSSMATDTFSDPYTRWAADEARMDAESSMPKRVDDGGDDPYNTILFSDVRPLLLDIITPNARRALRFAWLSFSGLHIPGFASSLSGYESRDDVWSRDHLSRPSFLRQLFPPTGKGKEKEWDAYAGTVIAREKAYRSPFGCVKEWGIGVFGSLEGMNEGEGRMWEKSDMEGINEAVVRRIFEQLRRKVVVPGEDEDEEWNIMAIAFEAAINPKSAAKLSRTLLSTARNSLPLWMTHARLERLRGKINEARKIYDAALSASPTDKQTNGEALLWWDWAEMEWSSGREDSARAIVLRAAGVDPVIRSSTGILRAKRTLEDRMRSRGRWKERECWTCLRALLELLSGGPGAVHEAMAVIDNYSRDSGLDGVARESAQVRMLTIGWKHSRVLGRQIRRRVLRDEVLKVVQENEMQERGANTAVLGMFLDIERGESVWGRVRALVGEGAGEAGKEKGLTFGRREKSLTRRIWEAWLATWEKGRWESEVERVRSSLGIGVGEDRTRLSPTLWRVYVELEIYFGQTKQAKALLFRAVSECPLVKELYLLAFGPLRSVFSRRELDTWAETMAERGIRMHRGLDEYLGDGTGDSSSGSESEGVGEVELEKEARDYRKLAPF